MRRPRPLPSVLAFLGLCLACRPAVAEIGSNPTQSVSIALEDFGYRDTSGEPTDQAAVHEKRLQVFMAALRRDLESQPRYQLVPPAQADAAVRIVGTIQKMSTLVQWAKVVVIDVGAKKVVFEKLYTFRGDNDEAWTRAEAFVSREVLDALSAAP